MATVTATATPSAPPSPTTTPTATPTATTTLSLYFLRGEALGVAERRVPQTTKPATAATEALLAGPTAAEKAAGLASAVPRGARLIGLSIDGTTARVNLSAQFAAGGGSLSMQARVAQIVYTLTRFPTIRAVDFILDGALVETLGGEGMILQAGQTRADWRDFEPAIFVESPGVGAVLGNPFAVSGTASVFEGSFQARLVDAGGGELASATIQASRGAPDRGRYRKSITFATTATKGELIVYSQSMEDGSSQNEVRIPVTFARQ
ncbi:MAG: GerMN domain-containing protein [Actinobacteria bacterium]|nr:GerMN domain-containing protein [Actinomycetota bacterium]